MDSTLSIVDLRVTYLGPPQVEALNGLTLALAPGECVGILGESGSGKSTLARALLGLAGEAQLQGELKLGDIDLTSLDEKRWRSVRWKRIACAMQSTASLNPVLRVGQQLAEPLETHLEIEHHRAEQRAELILEQVGLGSWAAQRFPGELSGGERRLVLLAMALVCDPEVVVLDEPTAGLDPVTRKRVLKLLARLQGEKSRTLLILGHDIDALDLVADRVAVVYRGWLAEIGPAQRVLKDPRNPYTWALLNSRPSLGSVKELRGIRGDPPNPIDSEAGCPFFSRCTQSITKCSEVEPAPMAPDGEDGQRLVACVRGGLAITLMAKDLRKAYKVPGKLLRRALLPAVNGVSLEVRAGEVVGLVGATGAGKSTLALLLVRLLEPDAGSIHFEGQNLLGAAETELRSIRRRLQVLFQDPFEALSPRMTVGEAVREPLDIQGLGTADDRDALVRRTLFSTRLPYDDAFLSRHTHELSGGQLQRVALARALVLEPRLLIADEPVSMLDPSEQAKMLQLLKHLQVERGMAMLLISHDLAVVLRVADRVLVLDRGRVVEEGSGSRLFVSPKHPATQALLEAAGRDALFAEIFSQASRFAERESQNSLAQGGL
jgi:peptide/nickel transport system ATP-binding protein